MGGDQTCVVTCCGDVSKRVEYHKKCCVHIETFDAQLGMSGTAKCNGGASHLAVYMDIHCESLLCFSHHFFLV